MVGNGGGRNWTAEDVICNLSITVNAVDDIEESNYLALRIKEAKFLLEQDGVQKTVGTLVGALVTSLLNELEVGATVTTNIMITETAQGTKTRKKKS